MQRETEPSNIGGVGLTFDCVCEVGVLQLGGAGKHLQLALGQLQRGQRKIHTMVVRDLRAL